MPVAASSLTKEIRMPPSRTWVIVHLDSQGHLLQLSMGKSVDVTVVRPGKNQVLRAQRGQDDHTENYEVKE